MLRRPGFCPAVFIYGVAQDSHPATFEAITCDSL
jgi:hypothetical protein